MYISKVGEYCLTPTTSCSTCVYRACTGRVQGMHRACTRGVQGVYKGCVQGVGTGCKAQCAQRECTSIHLHMQKYTNTQCRPMQECCQEEHMNTHTMLTENAAYSGQLGCDECPRCVYDVLPTVLMTTGSVTGMPCIYKVPQQCWVLISLVEKG